MKTPDRKWTVDLNDIIPRSDGLRILEFEKTVSWDLGLDEASRFSELTEARLVVCGGVLHVVGSNVKVNIERNCLSLLMSKNLKHKKEIKNVVPEPKKRVVSVSIFFSDSYVYEYLWTFSVSVWICLFHVFVSWSYIFEREYITLSSLRFRGVISLRAISISQTELFNPFLYMKPFNYEQTNDWY